MSENPQTEQLAADTNETPGVVNVSLPVDKFFLNAEQAYLEAEKAHIIVDQEGNKRHQYCYYDGPLTDIPLENFIQVPQVNFVEFFSNNQLPVPKIVVYENGMEINLSVESPDILEEILQYREKLELSNIIHKDTYFVDRIDALNVAKQKNRVFCNHPLIDGLQVCYYHGEEFPDNNLENLVNVNLNDIIGYFTHTRNRIFSAVSFPQGLEINLQSEISKALKDGIEQAIINRNAGYQDLVAKARKLEPDFNDTVKRVFLSTSRLTTVMQYCSKNVAEEFKRRGFEVFFEIESNEMEDRNPMDYMRRFVEFNPHITFNVNHLQSQHISPKVLNIVWWQDAMPFLYQDKPYEFRKNDLHLVYTAYIEKLIKKKHIEHYYQQLFCIDNTIFHNNDNDAIREDRIVFVGSSGGHHVKLVTENEQIVLELLKQMFENGRDFDDELHEELSQKYGIHKERLKFLIHFVFRYKAVKWMCEQEKYRPEVYGWSWEVCEEVMPYYQGAIEHGAKLADLYRRSKYALVVSPYEIKSQRLIEVLACGCIPIVYDSTNYCEYDSEFELTFFKTHEQFDAIINTNAEKANAVPGVHHYTYEYLLDRVLRHLKLTEPAAVQFKGADYLPDKN